MALPREGHLEQVIHIFGYLKQKKKLRIAFDPDDPQINPDCFKNMTGKSSTGIQRKIYLQICLNPEDCLCQFMYLLMLTMQVIKPTEEAKLEF